ncbi:HTH domain-containing protein [Mycoplasmopsis citelli]|uniref:ATP-binding protein n=1 Tax=Mycoplasmopsis citelli TaxID=171281 RepID=UPI002115BEB5|nr:ATP-binding protein [Mycoplasmopsis citelli]UUD35946.1 HTH domain-containing protein [Mycoplasmopsis citelli]
MIKSRDASDFETISIDRTDLTFEYLEKRYKEKGINFNKKVLSLVNKDGKYNNSALILSDQNPKITKFAVFQGTNTLSFRDKKEFEGSVLKQIDEVLYFANLSNRMKITISGKPDRDEYLDIPERALREAIVNCYCHRDYTLSGDIKIEFYDDRVIIFSPGSIPDGLTLENIKSGMVAKRNKNIVEALRKVGIIENYGTGVRRIFDDYDDFAKKPDYNISDNGVIVTLFNRNYQKINDTQNDTQLSLKNKPNERYKQIIKLIKKNKNITNEGLAGILKLSIRTIKRDTKTLIDDGKIKYEGSSKKGYWIIQNKNNKK